MTNKIDERKDLGIYLAEDPDFDQMTTAMQILHDELAERDETLSKLRGMTMQLAGMSARNALDIAEVKRLLRGLSKAGQIDIAAAEEAEGRSFVDLLDELPTEKQEAVLDHIIEIAGKARSQEEFDHGIAALIPSIYDEGAPADEGVEDADDVAE